MDHVGLALSFEQVTRKLEGKYAWVERGATGRFNLVVEDDEDPIAWGLPLYSAYAIARRLNEGRDR